MIPVITALRNLLLGLAVMAGLVLPAMAQLSDETRAAYQEWLKTADRAEDVIDANRASNAAMETLRLELTSYRQEFLEARTSNGDRIRTLESQLEALGPAPARARASPRISPGCALRWKPS